MKKLLLILVCCVGLCGESLGQGWFELGTGDRALKAHGPIYALCSDSNNNIYAAGRFSDDTLMFDHAYVAKWDNLMHIWTKLGVGSTALNANDAIYCLATDKHGNIYAAGYFTDGSSSMSGFQYVAKWDGASWTQLGTGSSALHADGSINSICTDSSGNVYAAGNFRNSYGESYVAKWNGAYWSELPGLHANLFINSICVDDSMNVYAGGTFSDTAGHNYVAKWNNAAGTWSELGAGFALALTGVNIESVKVDKDLNVFAAINFYYLSTSISFTDVYKWNVTKWSKLGNADSALNANNEVYDLCLGDSGTIYAAGAFTNSSGETYVAKYDPVLNYWSELGTGADGLHPHNVGFGNKPPIFALCTDKSNNVYAAGDFSDSISFYNNYMYVAEYGISTLQSETIQYATKNFEIFPNPTCNEIYIDSYLDKNNSPFSYFICNNNGEVVHSGKLHNSLSAYTKIDVSGLPAGPYLLKIDNRTMKFIKTNH